MSDNSAPPSVISTPPVEPRGAPAGEQPRTVASLLGIVVAQASFLVAIMYFLGAVYLTAYYSYFRLDSFSFGFNFAEVAIQSLNIVTTPMVIACVLVILVARRLATASTRTMPPATDGEGMQERLIHTSERALGIMARAHLAVVGSGLILLLLWPLLGEFRWVAPLLLGVGVLLGQSPLAMGRTTDGDSRSEQPAAPSAVVPSGTWSRAVPVFTAGLLVMWGFSLATGALGEQDAQKAAANLVHRPSVVLLSTERLSLAGPGLEVRDLGVKARYRYRYTGLRRLIERNGRYYLLPLGWTHRTGPTYVIRDSGNLRVEIFPGTQEV